MAMRPEDYVGAPAVAVECPRCGQPHEVPIVATAGPAVEYAGVCATPIAGGGFCSTTLRLSVTAHVFSAPGS